MAGRRTGLQVVITGDANQLERVFGKVGKGADQLGGRVGRASQAVGRALKTAAVVGTASLVGGLVVGLKKSVDAFAEAEGIAKQTETVLKSTGMAAKVTADQVSGLATSISRKSGIDDEAIQSAENMLLTFTKVRNEVGAGNQIFTRATQTVADFSVRFKKDLGGSAILVGKALNDPIKGVSALSRAGVQFTKQQKDQIKTLIDSGNVLGAQKIVLKELETQTKGAATAAGETFTGKINKAKVAVGNLGEAIGGRLAPIIADGAGKLAGFVDKLATSDRPAQFFETIGDAAGKARDAIGGVFDSIGDKRKGGASLGKAIGSSIGDAVADIDWAAIGKTISQGASGAVQIGGDIAKNVSDGIGAAFGNIDGRKLLAGLLRVISEAIDAVFSPSFWIDNFKNIFATVTIAIPFAKILKIPGANFLFKFISKPVFAAIGFLGKGIFTLLKDVGGRAFLGFLGEIAKVAPRTANALFDVVTRAPGALAKLPGKLRAVGSAAVSALFRGIGNLAERIGSFFGRAASAGIKALADKTAAYRAAAGVIGRALVRGVTNFAAGMARAGITLAGKIISGIVSGIGKGAGLVAKAVKGIVGKVLGAGASFLGIGDGIGVTVGKKIKDQKPTGPAGGGKGSAALMGAGSQLSPIAKVGASFGLHVTSGLRPGATTVSGNRSHHADGNAIDMGDGVPGASAAKLKAFRRIKFLWGPQLEELIYTPGGVGIKNGQPYTYTGEVAAGHYDHVHAAETTGVTSKTGDGLGVGGLFKRGAGKFTGDGIGVAVKAARAAGFAGTQLVNMIAIAARESGYNPRSTNLVPPDHSIGLWQINQLAHKGRYGTDAQLMNPYTNAKAARALFKQVGYSPWGGPGVSPFHNVTPEMFRRARAAVIASRSGASASSAGDKPGPAAKPETVNGTGYPLAKGGGKIIGRPNQGTHKGGPWQSSNAIDISVPVGSKVLAVVDGTITKIRVRPNDNSRYAGTQVTLEGRNNTFFYTHLTEATVKVGQKVKRGQMIGHSGSANGSPHLHFGQEHGDPTKLIGLAPFGKGGSSSGGSSGGSSDGMTEDEREGSREVNRLIDKYGNDHTVGGNSQNTIGSNRGPGISTTGPGVRTLPKRVDPGFRSLLKKADKAATDVEDAGTAYAQLDREFGQSDEDLGTAQGREKRGRELAVLKVEKTKQLDRQKKRAGYLAAAIAKYEGLLRDGRKARDKAKGKKRAKIVARLKTYDDKLVDLKAELKALGFEIRDTELDIGDLDKEAGDVAATPDTGSAPTDPPTASETVSDQLSLIDLKERAQLITPEQAKAARIAVLQAALAGAYGALSERETLQIMGDLIEAQAAAVAAITENTSALAALAEEMKATREFASAILATENYQLTKGLADILSGHIAGYGVLPLAGTAGSGVKARY